MLKKISVSLINFYQACFRVLLPAHCRFYPSCSEYAKQAILKYGFFKGGLEASKRLLRCHPFSGKFGDEPVG